MKRFTKIIATCAAVVFFGILSIHASEIQSFKVAVPKSISLKSDLPVEITALKDGKKFKTNETVLVELRRRGVGEPNRVTLRDGIGKITLHAAFIGSYTVCVLTDDKNPDTQRYVEEAVEVRP